MPDNKAFSVVLFENSTLATIKHLGDTKLQSSSR